MEFLICIAIMLTGIFFKTLNFTILTVILMMNFFLSSAVLFTMHITSSIMSTLFYHQNLFKYYSVMFNLSSMITIHFVPFLVGYLLKSLNGYF